MHGAAEVIPARKPQTFKLLPAETVLGDDYPVHPMYLYIVDGVFAKFNGNMSDTVGNWKKWCNIKEIRRCEMFGHEGARLGDRVE